MTSELEVLGLVGDRLTAAGLAFMLTGSFALAYYATPRMTRDLDIVVALTQADAASEAVRTQRLFNLMHLGSGIKIDLIVRKSSEYRQVEFARRQEIELGGFRTWIVSREDLILSKLLWAQESGSELQRRDVRELLRSGADFDYLRAWAPRLALADLLEASLA